MISARLSLLRPCPLVVAVVLTCLPLHAAEQKWLRVSSDHFSLLTDVKRNQGHEIIARFEQMRAVFADLLARPKVRLSQPIDILAIEDPATWAQLVPLVDGRPSNAPAVFLRGQERVFIVLNTNVADSWRAIERPFARYLLDYNYPPTQPWFDEGFVEHFASLYFTPQKTEMGSDPQLAWPAQGNSAAQQGKSLVEILNSEPWMTLSDLLQTKAGVGKSCIGKASTPFCAQSWMLVHYLISRNRLSETGMYFGLVEIQHMPVDQAIQQAFGMNVAQLDQQVKDYFHSLKPLQSSLSSARSSNLPSAPEPVNEMPLPIPVEDVAVSYNDVLPREAQALLAEMALRVLEHRKEAMAQLEKLAGDPKTETAIAHRALAWAYVQQGDSNKAFDELRKALQLNGSDPWSHFGVALAAYHSGQKGQYIQGLANTMESLRFTLNEYPDFAEAYNILGWARLAGGGGNAAVEAMKTAIRLSPRDETYQLRLARAYLMAKKFDEATATLERLQRSDNPEIAQAAAKDLRDLPFLKKYGVSPEEQAAKNKTASVAAKNADVAESSNSEGSDEQPQPTTSAAPAVDKRPMRFLKGRLVSVDCSQPPLALLLVSSGQRTMKLRVRDYNSMTLIGKPQFSCEWKNVNVSVNYREENKLSGDVVALEVE